LFLESAVAQPAPVHAKPPTETAGVAAVVNLRDGSVSGPIVMQLRFAAVTGGSTLTVSFGQPGIVFPSGVYLEKASGTIQAMIDVA
jgi:hypothetical protein